jgi:type IV secretion system protein VirB11
MTSLHPNERQRREFKLQRELGPDLVALMRDPEVREVMVNPDGRVFVDHARTGLGRTAITVEPIHMKAALGTLAALVDTVITQDQPVLQAELDLFGGRIEGMRAPVVSAPSLTFRKKATRVFSLTEYVESGRLTAARRDLLETAIAEKNNILVVGGTGSGKTTFINALLRDLGRQERASRVVLIEDTRELQCTLENTVALRAVSGVATMDALLKTTLRLRPDRIVVGEVRGPEALTLLKAWNTGHPGGFASLHANDAPSALRRLELLLQEASGHRLPELIAEVVDVIVHLERGARVEEVLRVFGHRDGKYETEVCETT